MDAFKHDIQQRQLMPVPNPQRYRSKTYVSVPGGPAMAAFCNSEIEVGR